MTTYQFGMLGVGVMGEQDQARPVAGVGVFE